MKVFILSDADAETLKNSAIKNVEIVATIKDKKLIMNGLDFYPQNFMRVRFNEMNNWVTIEFQLTNGQSLAIGEKD